MLHHVWIKEEAHHRRRNAKHHRLLMIYHFNHMYEEDHINISYDKNGNVTSVED
jgi:hypothetical protein